MIRIHGMRQSVMSDNLCYSGCTRLAICCLALATAALVRDTRGAAPAQATPFRPPMDVLYENRITVECDRFLSINLFNVKIDHDRAMEADRFTILSDDDPNYSPGTRVHPIRCGSRTRAVRVPRRKTMLVIGTAIFLELPFPMVNGATYRAAVDDLGGPVPELAPVIYDDQRQINDNIRLNQVGYLPGLPKRAYLGCYMGSAGGMPFDVQRFDVLDPTGKVGFTGDIRRRDINEDRVGQQVYELDFTAFDTPGAYRLRVPHVGLSYAFEIGSGALNPVFANLMHGNYQQRCGMAIEAPYSRHLRPACHLDDAVIEEKVEKLKFIKPKSPPLYPTRYGRKQQAIHGHHDAGDYGKYTTTGADYVFAALNAMEVFPGRFDADRLGLPYSGNGIPDVLEEVKWELDWLENMQDEDGGVFGVIKPNTGGYESSMPADKAKRLFYPKDTVFTAAYAAALAFAAASPIMQQYYPEDCARYLAKAVKAWGFLEQNERFVQYFHYGAGFGDWDERCWASAALYRATGEDKYHRAFLDDFDPGKKQWNWWPLTGTIGNAAYTYLFMKDRPRDQAMSDRCRQAVTDACAKYIRDGSEHPYRLSMPRESIRRYGWYFPGSMFGYDLLMGYALEPDDGLLACALDNLNYEMGANPSGYCLQTGIGSKRNIEVVDNESTFDRIIEPVPGFPLGIGTPSFYPLNQYGRNFSEATFPHDWPLLNRWYDGFNVKTEFTMGPLMRETLVAGFFARPSEQPRERPTVRIVAERHASPEGLTVQFDIQAHTPGGHVREVFWDFDDESFSIDSSPVHFFRSPGRQYEVAVTIRDDQGVTAFDTLRVGVPVPDARYPRVPFRRDGQTLALFHFDGDLRDDSAHNLKMQPEANTTNATVAFDDVPLWMEKPSGQCLKLDGKQQVTASVQRSLLNDPAKTPLTIEMMLYLEEFSGWGFPGNPIVLGLVEQRNSWLGWRQGTWDRAQAPVFAGSDGTYAPATTFAEEFPMNRWCHVRMVYDGKGHAAFYVDDRKMGEGTGTIFRSGGKNDLTLSLGPFRGLVDELRISTVSR